MKFIVLIRFKDTRIESRRAYIYISFKSLSRFSSSSNISYNIIYTNTRTKTNRLSSSLIPFPLLSSTKDFYLITANTCISIEINLSYLS